MNLTERAFKLAALARHEAGIPTGRIDPLKVAASLGIDVVLAPAGADSAVDGIYIRRAGRGFVFINSSKGRRRQRLTCAHEVGHHVLSATATGDLQLIEGSAASEISEERDAFHFASALLMDPEGVLDLVNATAYDRGRIAAVTKLYDVSPTSAAVRLAELGVITNNAATAFRLEMAEMPLWQAFMREFSIESHELGKGRTRFPPTFSQNVEQLHGAGILSDRRYVELVHRPTLVPPA